MFKKHNTLVRLASEFESLLIWKGDPDAETGAPEPPEAVGVALFPVVT